MKTKQGNMKATVKDIIDDKKPEVDRKRIDVNSLFE